MAWLSNYLKRKKVTVNLSGIVSNLPAFPVCIRLSDADMGAACRPDGYDIRFTTSDGTLLDYEREYFEVDAGVALGVFWVKMDLFTGLPGTFFYIYYGNPVATDGANTELAWHSRYRGVWHMYSNNTTIADSTSNHADGTKLTTDKPNTEVAPLYRGQEFNGLDSSITVGSFVPTKRPLTVECWYQAVNNLLNLFTLSVDELNDMSVDQLNDIIVS